MKIIVLVLGLVSLALVDIALGQQKNESKDILFADDFESGKADKWDLDESSVNNREQFQFVSDKENVAHGKRAVQFTVKPGGAQGVKLNKWLMPGYDQVFMRFYCKFDKNFDQGNHMHFVHLLANRLDNKWSAFGKAGIKPTGADFYTTGLEPWRNWGKHRAPGTWGFYAYHMDMPIDPKMNKYWGELMHPNKPVVLERDKWFCMEVMVKANTPGKKDGEQAYWIDGKKMAHFKTIRWRTDPELKWNAFWLSLYIHHPTKMCRVWFDDLVISRKYVGPLKPEG